MRNLKIFRPILFSVLVLGALYSCKKTSPAPPPTPPVMPPVNLVAYWPLNNSATDASRYGNNGIGFNVAPVTNRSGKADAAYHFNGQTSYIAVPDTPSLRISNTNFTVNCWEKLDSYSSDFASSILSKRIAGVNNGWLWAINGSGNSPLGAVYFGPGGGNSNAIGTAKLDTGKWYMITCVYTLAQQQLSIYINGSLDHTVGGISSPNASIKTPLYIGKDVAAGDAYFFHGSLDEIRIYNTALDIAAIQQLYTDTN